MSSKKIGHAIVMLGGYVSRFGMSKGIWKFVLDIARWVALPKGKLFQTVSFEGEDVNLRAGTSDLLVYFDLMVKKCYSVAAFPQWTILEARYRNIVESGRTPLIIDAGANIGLATLELIKDFRKARIVSIEPDNANFVMLKKNVSKYGTSIVPVNKCIWDKVAVLRAENEGERAFSYRFVEVTEGESGIASVTIDGILQANSDTEFFMLKMDIEGAESQVLVEDGNWWNSKPIILMESHDWLAIGRRSLSGILVRTDYQRADIIIKDSVIAFVPHFGC
ncbi:MAG: FkbM family methyltransferase [Roseiarcus sp.]